MKSRRLLIGFFLVFGILAHPSLSQKKQERQIRRLENDAAQLYDSRLWSEVLDYYLMLDSISPGNAEYEFRIGVIYYHSIDKARSLDYFLSAIDHGKVDPDLDFYLARAYHFNLDFDSAVKYYRKALLVPDSIDHLDQTQRLEIEKHIADCQLARKYIEDPLITPIENIGNKVNTMYPEYVPLVPADERMIIFTSRRPNTTGRGRDAQGAFMEDIYIADRAADGSWQEPHNDLKFNTSDHDACVGLSADGNQLILYRSENDGDLFISTFEGNEWQEPVPIEGINTSHWESSACFSADGKFIYYTSDKPGGFGGSDIYRARIQPDGKYGKGENLGPVINTPYDEDAPQIHSDGKTLFFSSKGHEGLGGYDIYSSVFDENRGQWEKPRNIGFPINTPDDDIYFTLLSNGTKGFFSSYRGDSEGEKDIYMITRPQSVPTKFLMKFKLYDPYFQKPIQARITITNARTNEQQVIEARDSADGKYAIPLDFETEYKLGIEAEGYQFKEKDLEIGYQADIFEYVMNILPKRDEVITLMDSLTFAEVMQTRQAEGENTAGKSISGGPQGGDIADAPLMAADAAAGMVVAAGTMVGINAGEDPGDQDRIVAGEGSGAEESTGSEKGKDSVSRDLQPDLKEGNQTASAGVPPDAGSRSRTMEKASITNGSNVDKPAVIVTAGSGSEAGTASDPSAFSETAGYLPVANEADVIKALTTLSEEEWIRDLMRDQSEVILLTRTERRDKVMVPIINFKFDSDELHDEYKQLLIDLAGFMKRNEQISLVIHGHTDSIGTFTYNQDLSKRRAEAVRDQLISFGVEADRIHAAGLSKEMPIMSNETSLGRRINRRANLNFIDIHNPKYQDPPYDKILAGFSIDLEPDQRKKAQMLIWEKLPVSVHFARNDAKMITDYSADKLDALAVYVRQIPYSLVIGGFEDAEEDGTLNLSRNREMLVRDYLLEKGVPEQQLLILDPDVLGSIYDVGSLPRGIERRRVQFFLLRD